MKTKNVCFPNLNAEMARKGLTIQRMAKELGVSRDTLSRRLGGTISLTDAFKIRDKYFPESGIEYLFEKE